MASIAHGVTVFVGPSSRAGRRPTPTIRSGASKTRHASCARRSPRKGLRLVDAPDAADIRVEVTNREQRDEGDGGFGGIKLTPLGETIIRFHADRRDGADIDLKGVGQGYWSRAARDGADHLLKWIARHQPRLRAR